jgi:hypothetical protein
VVYSEALSRNVLGRTEVNHERAFEEAVPDSIRTVYLPNILVSQAHRLVLNANSFYPC